LRGYENRVLGKIFGPEREEVRGGWRKLHREELKNAYTVFVRKRKLGDLAIDGRGKVVSGLN